MLGGEFSFVNFEGCITFAFHLFDCLTNKLNLPLNTGATFFKDYSSKLLDLISSEHHRLSRSKLGVIIIIIIIII